MFLGRLVCKYVLEGRRSPSIMYVGKENVPNARFLSHRMIETVLVDIYMLFTGWEVRIEKYFVEVSKTARGRRQRDVFETETKYFSIRTDLNGKKHIYFFVEDSVLLDCAYRKQNNKTILIFNYFTLENKQFN
jgi:hypothetical protein